MRRNLSSQRLLRPWPAGGRCVLPVPAGSERPLLGLSSKGHRQVAPRLTVARPASPTVSPFHPGRRAAAVELVGGVGLGKDILYVASGMTNE